MTNVGLDVHHLGKKNESPVQHNAQPHHRGSPPYCLLKRPGFCNMNRGGWNVWIKFNLIENSTKSNNKISPCKSPATCFERRLFQAHRHKFEFSTILYFSIDGCWGFQQKITSMRNSVVAVSTVMFITVITILWKYIN